MATAYIYPTSITPKQKQRCSDPNWMSNKNGCRDIQPLSTQTSWNSVCENNDAIICWGEVNPDAVDRNNPIYSSDFYNTITTYSGSYDTPTSFTTNGWKNIDNIPNSAKITKITVEYVWDQVKYTSNNNKVTWKGSGNLGHYQSSGGVFKSGPTITLNIGGKQLSRTGPGVRPASTCTRKNAYSYSNADLKQCSIDIWGATGMTMRQFKESKLTFTPSKNYASDVARIVMRYIRVRVEYDYEPPAFNIEQLDFAPDTVEIDSNDINNQTTLFLRVNNTSKIEGITQVQLDFHNIENFKFHNVKTIGNDTLNKLKDKKAYIWNIKTPCMSRSISIDLSCRKQGKHAFTATILNNKGKKIEKTIYINVEPKANTTPKPATRKEPTLTFKILDYKKNTSNKYTYDTKGSCNKNNYTNEEYNNNLIYLQTILTKNTANDRKEETKIYMDGLSFESGSKWTIETTGNGDKISIKLVDGKYYSITGTEKYTRVKITRPVFLCRTGIYNIKNRYISSGHNWELNNSYIITVKNKPLSNDFFKIKLEDGSDVKYNSLMITQGDDLIEPLTYTTKNINDYIYDMHVEGIDKRIPINEIQYINFNITLPKTIEKELENGKIITKEKDIELNNVLAYIDVFDENHEAKDIIVGIGEGATLLESQDEYICSIDSLTSKKINTIKIAVKSSINIEDVVIKLKPYNYDGYNDNIGWIPAHVMFKDIPNIKISIDGISDLIYENENDSIFWLYYKIQNLSDTEAKNVRFQLKEPIEFEKLNYQMVENEDGSWFNENNRIISFPQIEAKSAEKILGVQYKATKRGVYNFIIHTLDNKDDLIDDQYKNTYQHTVMVNILSEMRIHTSIEKKYTHINQLVDFNINVKNLYKTQDYCKFEIYDIGNYDEQYTDNTFLLENINKDKGIFNPILNNSYQYPISHSMNKIGEWELDDIDIDKKYNLTISMRPQDLGTHIIKTIFIDQLGNTQEFYNELKVLEQEKQLDFNVYHAISENDEMCNDCNNLIKICDDDFINIGDKIFYVFEIKNNNRNKINDPLYIYARLPQSFLKNDIICSSYQYSINKQNNLISFNIPSIEGCKDPNSNIKFCIKIQPSEVGQFISNFMLSTKNSPVLYKQLKLTVDTEFNNRQLEHEIKIYNFEKTNKYYRYEIDNVGEIFKFFNKGDKTLRPIQVEDFSKSAIETYTGTNIRQLVKDIKNKSKYVDPLFLRTGTNKLANKGYELFPDGLIRRFGLLNSEVYHYSGQFPIVSDLVDRAMRWEIDNWDTKVWAGDNYDNGVFDLTIDYEKVPSNFNILEVKNPIKNLQNLVDNVKPYGTKAICHYSATIDANLQIDVETITNQIKKDINVYLSLSNNLDIVSQYNKFDSSLNIYHDLSEIILKTEINNIVNHIYDKKQTDNISSRIDQVSTRIFADSMNKYYTQDIYDIISNTYNFNGYNIDITKPITNTTTNRTRNSGDIQQITFDNINDGEEIGFEIIPNENIQIYTNENIDDTENIQNNIIRCVYESNKINDFVGFKLILNENVIQEYNIIDKNIDNISLQIQFCENVDKKILHFWGSTNNLTYSHIGMLIINDLNTPTINLINEYDISYISQTSSNENDQPVTFKVIDKVYKANKNVDTIYPIQNKNKWQNINNIIQKDNKYAFFENNINIDKECESRKIDIPQLALKYNNIDIEDSDEIIDINFRINAQSNKANFEDDININLFKDGDMHIPDNHITRKIFYPSIVNNKTQNFLTNIDIEQENITICSNCLHTSLGYYKECPECGSEYVQHSNEKKPVTVCYNCGWIIDGWNSLEIDNYNKVPYCKNCLSYDVEETLVDYNKTYCNDCYRTSDDYYDFCPYCFSKNVSHLTNNTHKYKIFTDKTQNIEPIVVNTDNKIANIFTLHIPLTETTKELEQFKSLTLNIKGTNHNIGEYYYCEACKKGGIGHQTKCPYCGSSVINKTTTNNNIKTYYQSGDTYIAYNDLITSPKCNNKCTTDIPYNSSVANNSDFLVTIDLKKCACHTSQYRDKFKLIFDIENQSYNNILNEILSLPIEDEYQASIINQILPLNITVNNIFINYEYENEKKWNGLENIKGNEHSGIIYESSKENEPTSTIYFDKFNMNGKYEHAFLNIKGFFENISNSSKMNIKIINNNNVYEKDIIFEKNNVKYNYINANNVFFNYQYDLMELLKEKYIKNLSIELTFNNNDKSKIIITDVNVLGEGIRYSNNINNIDKAISQHTYIDNNIYKFTSNNLWNINNNEPYYLSGNQLKTNLIAYIDFGKLDLEEYIKIYNIEMILLYKKKNGYIITDSISVFNNNDTFKVLLKGLGYNDNEIENIIDNNTPLNDILINKGLLQGEIEQIVNGDIDDSNGVVFGNINYSEEILNNLEYEITNINSDNETINAIPLKNKIAQSFKTEENISSINKICINYFGKRGYPSNNININICEDNNNTPGNIIASNKTQVNNINETLNIDFNIDNLKLNSQYWIVIEDITANENNYHLFSCNDNEYGKLITYKNSDIEHSPHTLSFSIEKNIKDNIFYTLPTVWGFNTEQYDNYKICTNLYRYNVKNNVSLSKFNIKSGYNIININDEYYTNEDIYINEDDFDTDTDYDTTPYEDEYYFDEEEYDENDWVEINTMEEDYD